VSTALTLIIRPRHAGGKNTGASTNVSRLRRLGRRMKFGISANDIGATVHAFPTYSNDIKSML
jgi:hypothetical protein